VHLRAKLCLLCSRGHPEPRERAGSAAPHLVQRDVVDQPAVARGVEVVGVHLSHSPPSHQTSAGPCSRRALTVSLIRSPLMWHLRSPLVWHLAIRQTGGSVCRHRQGGEPGRARTEQPFCAAGTANGPMPAMTSTTTWPGRNSSTRRLCSASRREFQYTCARARGAGPARAPVTAALCPPRVSEHAVLSLRSLLEVDPMGYACIQNPSAREPFRSGRTHARVQSRCTLATTWPTR